jgi:predicted transcriptional regulator
VIVREALVPDPRVLAADAPAREAAELLTHPHVLRALVTDGDHRLLGTVTVESVVAAVARGTDMASATARDVCETDVFTENGHLLGVLPREPVVRRLAEDDAP